MSTHRILLVDDDQEALKLIGLMLRRAGYQVLTADSGRVALDRAVSEHPDLIILDVMMPDIDGYQILARLRQIPATASIPVMIFTAKTSVNDKIAGFQAGADDYLTKPVHPAQLISHVKTLLRKKQAHAFQVTEGRLIGFLPTKGGLGTTSLALNTAFAMTQQLAHSVALLEWRDGGGSMGLHLGITETGNVQTLLGWPAALLSREVLRDHMLHHPDGPHLLLSTPVPHGAGPSLTREFTQTILQSAGELYDYVLLDLPSALDEITLTVLNAASRIVLTLSPDRVGVAMAKAMLTELDKRAIEANKIGAVLLPRSAEAAPLDEAAITRTLGVTVLGIVPADAVLAHRSTERGKLMVKMQPEHPIAHQVNHLARTLLQAQGVLRDVSA